MFSPPDIPYFLVFGFPVYYYGIILAISIFTGIIIANWISVKEYYLFGVVPDIATSIVICGIIGARLYYCLLNTDVYFNNPIEILMIREGGLSIHGAIIGGAVALFFQAKKHNIHFFKLGDIFVMGLPIAQAIGRWGNFFNSEAFGQPSDLPLKMYIRPSCRPEQFSNFEYFHPAFLYESVLNVVIFIILYKYVLPKYKGSFGIISAFYLILYSFVRILIELIRVDCVRYIFNIPFPIIVSVVLIILSVIFISIRVKR